MNRINIMAAQIGFTADKEDNLKRAESLIEDGLRVHPEVDLICLPEFFYECPTRKNRDTVGEPLDGKFLSFFSNFAREKGVNIVTGTFPKRENGKLYNTALAINRKGKLMGEYSKIHLFDAFQNKESDYLSQGDSLGIFDFDFGKVGVAICYELRFPEYLRTIALAGADILLIPAMFYRPRSDQWDLLVQSAALGNALYVVASNQYSKYCFGRSQIVDPCGRAVAQASDREEVIFASIDLDYQEEIRKNLGIYENRVPGFYKLK